MHLTLGRSPADSADMSQRGTCPGCGNELTDDDRRVVYITTDWLTGTRTPAADAWYHQACSPDPEDIA